MCTQGRWKLEEGGGQVALPTLEGMLTLCKSRGQTTPPPSIFRPSYGPEPTSYLLSFHEFTADSWYLLGRIAKI